MKKRMLSLLLAVLMLVSLFPTGIMALGVEKIARDKAESERDNVQLSKMVSEHLEGGVFDGTYDITLEAYANGYYKPVDVILVVDQSGSMSSNTSSTNKKTNLVNLKAALNTFAESLKDVDKSNTLTIVGFASNDVNYNNSAYENTELFNGSSTTKFSGSKVNVYLGEMDTSETYYATVNSSKRTITYDSSKGQWGYTSSGSWKQITPKSNSGSSGTQVYKISSGFTAAQYQAAAKSVNVNGKVNSDITASINALAGSGATYTQFGMEMAYEALQSRTDGSRNSIVVLFTDGYPGQSAGSKDTSAANAAVSYANAIKSEFNSKIYTVGLGCSDYTDMVSFLKLIQSTGDEYLNTTQDSAMLPDLFNMIYKDVIGVNEAMTATAKLVDTLSDKFELVGTVDEAIKVSQLPYQNPTTNNAKEWGAEEAVDSAVTKSYNAETRTVSVSGFNFASIDTANNTNTNAVYYDSKGVYHGHKLRVVIHVKPKAGDDACWNGVEYGELNIVPTELVQLTDSANKMIAEMKSADSDYFAAFMVKLHHVLVSVEDRTELHTGSKITSDATPDATTGYTVTAAYTAAAGTDKGEYTGSFKAATKVMYNEADVTKTSILRYAPGKLNIVDGNAYIVTVKGKEESVLYDGKNHTSTGYTVTVTKNGVGTDECAEGTDFTVTCNNVTKKNAGTYTVTVSAAATTSGKTMKFICENGTLTISKRHITMESASAEKDYDGKALVSGTVTVGGDKFADGEGVDYEVKGSQTEVGSSTNWFTYSAKSGTNMDNYVVTEKEGTLTVHAASKQLTYDNRLDKDGYHSTNKKVVVNKTVTLVLKGGTYPEPTGWIKINDGYYQTITADLTVKRPTKKDYVFIRWDYSKDLDDNVTLTAVYEEDKLGNQPDGIPDPYQFLVTMEIVNGTWDGSDSADKVILMTKTDAQGNYDVDGTAKLTAAQIPTGMTADTGYASGSWGSAVPSTDTALSAATNYTYTYQPQDNALKYPSDLIAPNQYKNDNKNILTDKTVTLILNQGSFPQADRTALLGDSWADITDGMKKTITGPIDLTGKIPLKNKFVFDGWDYSADGNGNVTLTARYEPDELGGPNGDKIPDNCQKEVIFRVVNGKWNDGTNTNKSKVVTLYDAAGKLSSTGTGILLSSDLPAVGQKPAENYTAGTWNVTISDSMTITKATSEYVYTYNILRTITYPEKLIKNEKPKYQPKDNKIPSGNTLTLLLNGGSYDAVPVGFQGSGQRFSAIITANLDITGDSYLPARTGYVFDGWDKAENNGDITLTARWLEDVIGPGNQPDGVPDQYQFIVTMKIENGTWNGSDNGDKTVILSKVNSKGELALDGTAKLTAAQIPTGMVPDSGYKDGSWGSKTPNTTTALSIATTYTYTFSVVDNSLKFPVKRQSPTKFQNTEKNIENGKIATIDLQDGQFLPDDLDALYNDSWGDVIEGIGDLTKIATGPIDLTDKIPEKNGFVFDGWDSSMDDGNYLLTARWLADSNGDGDPDEYQVTVTFVVKNGQWSDGASMEKTAVVTLYEGDVWSKTGVGHMKANDIPLPASSSLTGTWDTVPTAALNITAPTTYTYYFRPTVTYNANGGTMNIEGSQLNVWSYTPEFKAQAQKMEASNGSLLLAGWYLDTELTKSWNFKTGVTENITLYAKWVKNLFTVTVTLTEGSSKTMLPGAAITLMAGENLAGTAVDNGDGTYTIDNVAAGDYNVLVSLAPRGTTVSITVDDNKSVEINLPLDAISTKVEKKNEKTRDTSVDKLDELAEVDEYKPGPSQEVEIIMDVEAVEATGDAENKVDKAIDAIEDVRTEDGTIEYVNIDITRFLHDSVTGTSSEAILETSNVLAVTIQFPTEGRYIYVYRNHVDENNVATTIPLDKAGSTPAEGTYTYGNNSVTIYSSYFSVFGISYEDIPSTPIYIAPTMYSINVETPENGTLKADRTSASAGTRVTLTAAPATQYKLLSMTVTDAAGNAIELTKVSDNQYTFVMPSRSVTAKATFKLDTGVPRWLNTVDHVLFISGYSDNTVRPLNNLTRAETAMMFYRLLLDKNVAQTKTFTDVADDAWYAAAVRVLASMNIITGYEDETFRPDQAITRAEFTAIAMRFAYMVEGDKTFIDVTEDFWAKPWITAAATYGWIGGYNDGTFKPNDPIIRAEAATIINRMLERSADESYVAAHQDELKQFSDLQDSEQWYYYNMVEAINEHDYTISIEDGKEYWVKK